MTLYYTHDYTLHHKLWIYVQVNSKLNVREQSVTRFIIKSKYAFEKFMVQSVIWDSL